KAVPQAIARLVQRSPGVGPDDAVLGQPAAALELDHRPASVVTELAPGVVDGGEAEGHEAALDVTDRFSAVAVTVQAHYAMVRSPPPPRRRKRSGIVSYPPAGWRMLR